MTYQRILIAYLLTVIVVQATFAAFPEIDLAVSRLFTSDSKGFDWVLGVVPTINLAVRRIGEAVAFLVIGGFFFGLLTGKLRGDDLRLLAYPGLCVAVACGGIVNLLLKSHIGRARPDSLAEFGGTAVFSPPWQVVDQCTRNCSFTSGEAAMAASLAIPAVVILWPHLTKDRGRLLAVLSAVVYIAATSLLRIGLGRHFLSDTIYSVLFAAGAALVLYPLLRIAQARRHLPVLAPRAPLTEAVQEQRGVF
jgi:lipid A 4'-phosphatase